MRHRNLYKCIAKTIYNKKAILRKSPFLRKQHITVLCKSIKTIQKWVLIRNVSTPNLNALHRFPMLFIKLSDTGIEAKTSHRVSLVSAHVTTLEEDLKQQPLCQDSPKDVLSDSGLEIELAIPFVPNRDPPDTPQQSELGEVVHYHPSE
ncbi:uncharacterized protein TNCV_387381 [Trichonephila clavipes]|nr:uncharacterized protein TNCV_387381 [Trichonephila clavipes]